MNKGGGDINVTFPPGIDTPLLFDLTLHRIVRPLAERLKGENVGWSVWYHLRGLLGISCPRKGRRCFP